MALDLIDSEEICRRDHCGFLLTDEFSENIPHDYPSGAKKKKAQQLSDFSNTFILRDNKISVNDG